MFIAFVALDKDGRVVGYGVHEVKDKTKVRQEIKDKFKRKDEIKTIEILMKKGE